MYWKVGFGKKLDIYLNGDSVGQIECFYCVLQSVVLVFVMVEEFSDQVV